jgi:hypothetical protein
VQSQILGLKNPEHQDRAIKSYQQYAETMYSFLNKAAESKQPPKEHAQLLRFVAQPVSIDLRPVWRAKIQQRDAKLRRANRTRNFGVQTKPTDGFIPSRK